MAMIIVGMIMLFGTDTTGSPPYPPNTFDMVLLDGPCSALGQRPIAVNKMSAKCLESFPRIQRSLLLAVFSQFCAWLKIIVLLYSIELYIYICPGPDNCRQIHMWRVRGYPLGCPPEGR